MTGSEPAVFLEHLRFGYRPDRVVLDIAELVVPRGERVFLHGPSGSGKTTLLGILAGVLEAKEGVVRVLGRDLTRLSGARRDAFRAEHLGYIFQMFNLIPYLDVVENIALPARISSARRARLDGRPVEEEALRLAEQLGIGDLARERVTDLSVGQQQRVAAARALLGAPELVVADEPTSALDADRREAFLELLFGSCEKAGSTLLFVSHDDRLRDLFDRSLSLVEVNRALGPDPGPVPARPLGFRTPSEAGPPSEDAPMGGGVP